MTLKEIAQKANVSISTVSRVINQKNTKAASQEVQERIWEIVRESGYTPNTSARALKMGAKAPAAVSALPKTISCIYARGEAAASDLFFSYIAKSIEQEAFKSNFFIKHSFTALDLANVEVAARVANSPADGAVILGRYDKQILKFFTEHYKHIVYAGLNPMGSKYDQVVCDGREITFSAISYLQELGHTKIGYIGEQNNEIRYTAFKEALKSFNLPFLQKNTANVKLSHEGGYQGAYRLMEAKADITAIFCANDNTAIKAIREKGYRIPEDISIIGVDDIETAQYLSPMLTTVHIPTEEMGQLAAKILIDRINGGHRIPLKLILPFHIAKRDTCATPARNGKTFYNSPV